MGDFRKKILYTDFGGKKTARRYLAKKILP